MDAGESVQEAAVRECREEIALPHPDAPTPLGLGHDAIAITGTHVTPVVGHIDGDAGVCLREPPASPDEVAEVFTLSLPHLAHPSNFQVEDLSVRYKEEGTPLSHRPYTVPIFTGGPRPVWGLTAWMLDGLMRQVLLPAWNEVHGTEGGPLTMPPLEVHRQ